MKRIILFLAMVAMLGCSPSGYVIKGKFDDVKEGRVYIKKLAEEWMFVDSVDIKSGKFVFKVEPVQEIGNYYLMIKDSVRIQRPFFIENGNITVSGNVGKVKINVEGTTNNNALNDYFEAMAPLSERMMKLLDEAKRVWLSGDTTKADSFGKVFMDIRAEYPKLRKSYVQKYKDIDFGVYLYTEMISGASTTATFVDSLITLVPVSLSNSPFLRKMKERAEALRACDPGTMAQDIDLPTPEGSTIALSSLRGKYVLLDFWASWCGPCRGEIPHLKKAYEAYHADGFEIYSVSLDNKRDAWEKALTEEGMPWIQVSDLKGMKSPAAKKYSVNGIPATWLLGKDGKIIAKNLRGEELSAKLKEIFGH